MSWNKSRRCGWLLSRDCAGLALAILSEDQRSQSRCCDKNNYEPEMPSHFESLVAERLHGQNQIFKPNRIFV